MGSGYESTVSLPCAVVPSTRTIIRTTPVVRGSEKRARAIPPRVLVSEGTSEALRAQSGSSSNVTGTSSTGRPWASCTVTITVATCGNCAAAVEGTGPSQTVGSETCTEKTYPEPAVGPTRGDAQAPPPQASPRHTKIRVRCRTIQFSRLVPELRHEATAERFHYTTRLGLFGGRKGAC